jgi:hypothetical protein
VHFLNVFLKKAGPEGLGKKNFKKLDSTQLGEPMAKK